MPTPKLTNAIIEAAIDGFEAQKSRIDVQIAELRSMLSDSALPPAGPESGKPARRKMSAAGRKAIAAAQRQRWAARQGVGTPAPAAAKPKKRKMSAEGRANIIAALKKRWASKKAAAKK